MLASPAHCRRSARSSRITPGPVAATSAATSAASVTATATASGAGALTMLRPAAGRGIAAPASRHVEEPVQAHEQALVVLLQRLGVGDALVVVPGRGLVRADR